MRVARVDFEGQAHWAQLSDDKVYLLDADPIVLANAQVVREVQMAQVRLLAPCTPSKIVAVGVNYAAHAGEMGHELAEEPILFLKPPSAIIAPDELIHRPGNERVDYEGELALIISKECHDISPESWREYVFGFTCLNDVTARQLQSKDGQWTRAKGFDTFSPIGPWIETELDPADLKICTRLNGQVVQESTTALLLCDVPNLLAFISRVMTLVPGDVITTGTPAGIGPMEDADVVEVEVEGIGVLRNTMA